VGVSQVFFQEGRRLIRRLFGVLGARIVIAVCLLIAASVALSAARNLWFSFRAVAVNGIVVRQDEEWTADWQDRSAPRPGDPRLAAAERVFRAVVEFSVDGRAYEVLSMRAEPVQAYPLGSRQAVVYPAGQPQKARIRAELPDFWTQAGLLLMGTVVGAGTARWWWSMARRRPRFRRRPGPSRRRVNLEAAHWLRLGIEKEEGEDAPPAETTTDGKSNEPEQR
jgi:hypothetical protein